MEGLGRRYDRLAENGATRTTRGQLPGTHATSSISRVQADPTWSTLSPHRWSQDQECAQTRHDSCMLYRSEEDSSPSHSLLWASLGGIECLLGI